MSNYLDENKKWLALMEGDWNRSYGYPKRRSSRSPLDYERADRHSFKRDELEYELRHEKKYNFAVYINDKLWKIVSDEDRARRMVGTLLKKGKDARFQMTRSPVSESHPSKDQLADRWNDLDGDHGDNPKVKPFISKAEAAFKDGDLETAMDMIKAGEEAARSLEEDFDDLDISDDEWPDPLYDIKYAIETMQVPASALKDPMEMSKFIDNAYDWEMLDGPEYSPEELAPVLKKYYKELLAFLKKKDQGGMWESKDGIDQHPEVRKRYDAMLKTKPDSHERRRAVRAYMNKKKELRREVAESIQSIGYDDMSNQETENVSYSKTKTNGDASVTVSANAKSMQELHDILKLAGVSLSDDHPSMQEPEAPEEPCGVCSGEEPMPSSTNLMGYSYETDKEKIADVIRDKLNQRLK